MLLVWGGDAAPANNGDTMIYHFDGSTYRITLASNFASIEVAVTEGGHTLSVVSHDGHDIANNGRATADAAVRDGMDKWTADRIAYCFYLAQRRIDVEAMAA